MSTPSERKAIRDLGVRARELILLANHYVERRGDAWYVDREKRNWAGSLTGAKRDLTADEWRKVEDRLNRAVDGLAEARRLVRLQIREADDKEAGVDVDQ